MEKQSKVTKLKRMLCKLSYAELVEIRKYAEERAKIVYRAEAEKAATKAWNEFLELNVKPGTLVWNTLSGISLYHTCGRLSAFIVFSVLVRAGMGRKPARWIPAPSGRIGWEKSSIVGGISEEKGVKNE